MGLRARRAGLEAYTNAFEAKRAECDWAEILKEANLTQKESETIETQMMEDIVGGYAEWKGDNMHIKQNKVGCRLVITNAAKKLMTELDVTGPDDKKETILHLDYLIEYMQAMHADIMVCHEPGNITKVKHIIEKKAEAAQMEVLIDCSEDGKAAGTVIILGSKWKRARRQHTEYRSPAGGV